MARLGISAATLRRNWGYLLDSGGVYSLALGATDVVAAHPVMREVFSNRRMSLKGAKVGRSLESPFCSEFG
jgi:hypothetical protein